MTHLSAPTPPAAAAHTATLQDLPFEDLTAPGTADTTISTLGRHGEGHPYLLLHGGAGPQSVAAFAGQLATDAPGRVIAPTHPGFGGTRRPDRLDSIAKLAVLYRNLLDRLGLENVTVVGNSIGGWAAAELALLRSPRVSRVILVNAVGILVKEAPVTEISGLTPDELSRLSFHDPAPFRVDPASLTEQQLAAMAANRRALAVYGGQPPMTDPALRDRLAGITTPTLVLWGESDEIVTPAYGRAYAEAIPGAEFRVLPGTGHVPQIETPQQLLNHVRTFAEAQPPNDPA
ncbi:alpha/beta fold hydrolase [Streptomyces sp. NPDC001820]|uniref:alpha/beta fold hydrolase n=1 Tax=Streptomyces sp. NPDC001820 TaxID=3364613 RepID=UPI003695D2F2